RRGEPTAYVNDPAPQLGPLSDPAASVPWQHETAGIDRPGGADARRSRRCIDDPGDVAHTRRPPPEGERLLAVHDAREERRGQPDQSTALGADLRPARKPRPGAVRQHE